MAFYAEVGFDYVLLQQVASSLPYMCPHATPYSHMQYSDRRVLILLYEYF
jgi:hypothetical protein